MKKKETIKIFFFKIQIYCKFNKLLSLSVMQEKIGINESTKWRIYENFNLLV